MTGIPTHNVRKHLALGNADYDEAIRRFIPGYEEMLSAAADAVISTSPSDVQDLGAGTGALSEAILKLHRSVKIELLDIDPEMLEIAKQRLLGFGDRVRYSRRSFSQPLESSDAFVASLSLHHVATLEAKAAVYSNAFESLRPGGVLVNADVNMPADQKLQAQMYQIWADHLVSCGISEIDASNYFDEWSDEDTYLPLEDELSSLDTIGFEASCIFSRGPVNVVVAKKL